MNLRGGHATGGHCIPGAQPLQSVHGIWPQLKAGAYLIKYRGLFQDEGRPADAGKAKPCGKARNSAANYKKW